VGDTKPNPGGWPSGAYTRKTFRSAIQVRNEQKTHCPNNHELKEPNLKFGKNKTNRKCRACVNAQQWARRNNYFIDDPRTLEYADELYRKYMGSEVESSHDEQHGDPESV